MITITADITYKASIGKNKPSLGSGVGDEDPDGERGDDELAVGVEDELTVGVEDDVGVGVG